MIYEENITILLVCFLRS